MNKVLSIFFLFVFSFSIASFSAEIHYCKGELKDITFIGHGSCVICDSEMPTCKMHNKGMNCCETSVISHTSSDEVLDNSADINDVVEISPVFIAHFFDFNLFFTKANQNQNFKVYCPPELDRNIPVFIQSFLI